MSLSQLSSKTIYLSDEFVSYSSSLLHLPIFTSLHSKDDNNKTYVFKTDRYWGFNDLSISAPWLSINWDFTIFTYILRQYYKSILNGSNISEETTIDFSIDNFFKENEIKTNKKYYAEQIKSTIEKLTKITIHFTKNNKRYYCRVISSGCIYNTKQLTGSFKLSIDKHFINFFNHDPNLILNIDHKKLSSIKGDYAKILYTFYKTNQQAGLFEKEIIIQRLRPDADKKDFRRVYDSIKIAHKELLKCGFIKSVSYQKNLNSKEISHFLIKLNNEDIFKDIEKKRRKISKNKEKTEKEELKTDISGFDDDNFIDNPKDDEIPF